MHLTFNGKIVVCIKWSVKYVKLQNLEGVFIPKNEKRSYFKDENLEYNKMYTVF